MTESIFESLAPGLLVASTSLEDSNFRRAVILMVEHNSEGALGIVLNRVSDASVRELCADQGLVSESEAMIRVGGPVSPERVWVIHPTDATGQTAFPVGHNVAISITREALGVMAGPEAHIKDGNYIVCAGYAGWGAGQLENEIAQGAWIPCPVEFLDIFATEAERMWSTLMLSLGVFSTKAGPHSVN